MEQVQQKNASNYHAPVDGGWTVLSLATASFSCLHCEDEVSLLELGW